MTRAALRTKTVPPPGASLGRVSDGRETRAVPPIGRRAPCRAGLGHDFGRVRVDSGGSVTPQVQAPLRLHRAPAAKAEEFPGFSQGEYKTCGAASLVTALMIWDKERKDPAAPNELLVTACNIALVHMEDHKAELISDWTAEKLVVDDKTVSGAEMYTTTFDSATLIRDIAREPGSKITDTEYQIFGGVLFALFTSGFRGLGGPEVERLRRTLGLHTRTEASGETLEEILSSSVLAGLTPGQIAQVLWYGTTGPPDVKGKVVVVPHAFLIGRFKRGPWFLSDQGSRPPTELEAADLASLKTTLYDAIRSRRSSIHGGPKPGIIPAPFTGVLLLARPEGVELKAAADILRPGTFLGEVDVSAFSMGDRVLALDFVAREYSLDDAKAAFRASGSGHGGIIVEKPTGLFHVYETSPVTDTNVGATTLDKADSAGGFLSGRSAEHAWLVLCTEAACAPDWLTIY